MNWSALFSSSLVKCKPKWLLLEEFKFKDRKKKKTKQEHLKPAKGNWCTYSVFSGLLQYKFAWGSPWTFEANSKTKKITFCNLYILILYLLVFVASLLGCHHMCSLSLMIEKGQKMRSILWALLVCFIFLIIFMCLFTCCRSKKSKVLPPRINVHQLDQVEWVKFKLANIVYTYNYNDSCRIFITKNTSVWFLLFFDCLFCFVL